MLQTTQFLTHYISVIKTHKHNNLAWAAGLKLNTNYSDPRAWLTYSVEKIYKCWLHMLEHASAPHVVPPVTENVTKIVSPEMCRQNSRAPKFPILEISRPWKRERNKGLK